MTTDDAAPGRHNTDQTVTLSRSDAGSGPSATQYRVRPPGGSFGAWQSGTSVTIFASAGDGVWTIEYFSTDAAGNVESVKSTDVLIDTTGPSGTVTDPSTFLRGLVTLTATADDPTDVSSVKFEYAPEGTSAWTQIGTDLTANGSDEYTDRLGHDHRRRHRVRPPGHLPRQPRESRPSRPSPARPSTTSCRRSR